MQSGDEFAAPPEPMTDAELQGMIAVLVKDAHEVEDVVTEIRERGSEMTFLLNEIENHINHLRNEASALSSILQMISQITGEVKSHIVTTRSFHASWLDDTRPALLNGIEEWENQRDFYEIRPRLCGAACRDIIAAQATREGEEKSRRSTKGSRQTARRG
jgi:autophagy-related protein 17